jgi:hypothetical protein
LTSPSGAAASYPSQVPQSEQRGVGRDAYHEVQQERQLEGGQIDIDEKKHHALMAGVPAGCSRSRGGHWRPSKS